MVVRTLNGITVGDIVKIGGGGSYIITNIYPHRPVHQYTGIAVNGHGTEYKIGHKHRLSVIGKADPNHPALVAYRQKKGIGNDFKILVDRLCQAVEQDDLAAAKALVTAIKELI